MRCECGKPATYKQPRTGRLKANGQHHLCQECYNRQMKAKTEVTTRREFTASVKEAQLPPELLDFTTPIEAKNARQMVIQLLPFRSQRALFTRGLLQTVLFLCTKEVSPGSGYAADLSLRLFHKIFDLLDKHDGHVEAVVEELCLWSARPEAQVPPEKAEALKPIIRKMVHKVGLPE